MTDSEKNLYVSGKFLTCMVDFGDFKKGEKYWLEYVGDDYQFFEEMEDGTKRTWYNNGDDRGDIEGYRPNLPTHYKRISIDNL